MIISEIKGEDEDRSALPPLTSVNINRNAHPPLTSVNRHRGALPPLTSVNRHRGALPPVTYTFRNHVMLVTYKIHIQNDLPWNMFLHCESGDDDLGSRYLSSKERFTWGLMVNFFHTTLFHCRVSAPNDIDFSFDAFRAPGDEYLCARFYCSWSIKKDGIYFSSDNNTWFRRFSW
ncbi:Plant self-incompatibility protein S1 family [Euphorbia peplus]|nr:Plant self-incompatibility protein S1 family [Euphorbia peplus]